MRKVGFETKRGKGMTIAICIPKLTPTAAPAESSVPLPRRDAAAFGGPMVPRGDGGAAAEPRSGARGQVQKWCGALGSGGGSAAGGNVAAVWKLVIGSSPV